MEAPTRAAKKRRASRPKVRTGCATCKIRRLKCDENKPECFRCQQFGAECEYTPPRSRTPARTLARLHGPAFVPIQPRLPLLYIHGPSASLPGDEVERRYFRLFHEKLAFDLCGHFATPLWTRLIPQECHHEPAIRHAIFALSALYKSAASKTHAVKTNDEHLNFALVQHSKAIRSLRKTLSNGHPQVRLALIASLLFSCFESFHGNWENAAQQICSGLNILKYLQEDRTGKATQSLPTIGPELGLTLGRLKLQIFSFLAMSPMCENPFTNSEDEETMEDLPDRFATLNEAFQVATRVATLILQYSRRCSRCRDIEGPRESITRQRESLNKLVDQWNKAYHPIFLEACQNVTSRQYLGAILLRTCIWAFKIIFSTSMSKEEIVFDNFTERFQEICFFSRHQLEKDQEIRGLDDGLRVQYGMGLIMTLFFTATRCRDFSIRREAIAILREWPCMNGIWNSLLAAKVAEWIVSIEEKGCDSNGFIPEESRVRMNSLKVTLQYQYGEITVECMQGSMDGVLTPRKANILWP